MDKLKDYRLKNPLQIDIFHYLEDVKREDKMISKGKLKLTPEHEYYDLYSEMWFDILDIDKNGLLTCEVDKHTNKQIIHISDNYILYEHYIKGFRITSEELNSDYKPIVQEEFNKFLENRINKIYSSLSKKGLEYSSNDRTDRMHNFITAAKRSRDTPEKALDGMLAKHLISYQDIIDDLNKGIIPDEATILEKYGDIINYFILSEMLLLKRLE